MGRRRHQQEPPMSETVYTSIGSTESDDNKHLPIRESTAEMEEVNLSTEEVEELIDKEKELLDEEDLAM